MIKIDLTKEEKKSKMYLTDNRMVTINRRETSFEGLVAQLENGEDGIYNMMAEDGKNTIFQPKIMITKKDVEEVVERAKINWNLKTRTILFVDEIHNLIGAGAISSGSMEAGEILKPALARGDLQIIGATTYDEYHKYIEKDPALERRFQPVMVSEPTIVVVDSTNERNVRAVGDDAKIMLGRTTEGVMAVKPRSDSARIIVPDAAARV